MGSCVSVHKDPESGMKVRFSIGKGEKLLIPSPVKKKDVAVNAGDRTAADIAVTYPQSPSGYTNIGSKDEAFFDSQPWLESDCEDDFVSVNGDFSRGSTPVHPNSLGKPVVDKLPLEEEAKSEQSPPDKKKRLSELFKESLRNEEYSDEEKPVAETNEASAKVVAEAKTTTLAQHIKSADGTPYYSRANSGGNSEQTTPNEGNEKWFKSPQCCLPKMLSSRSLNERRKRTSPTRNVG